MGQAKRKTYRIERDVKATVRQCLTEHGWMWRMPANNGYGKSGIADFIALRRGTFMAVETKNGPNDNPTVPQNTFLVEVSRNGGLAFVVDAENVETFTAFMDAYDRMEIAVSTGNPPSPEDKAFTQQAVEPLTRKIRHDD